MNPNDRSRFDAQLGRTGHQLLRMRVQQLTTVVSAVGRIDLANIAWLDQLHAAAIRDAGCWELQDLMRMARDLSVEDPVWHRWLIEFRDTLHLTVYCGVRARGAPDALAVYAADQVLSLVMPLEAQEALMPDRAARFGLALEPVRRELEASGELESRAEPPP